FSGLSDAQNDGTAVARTGVQLGFPFAKNEGASRFLSFDKQHRAFWISGGGLDRLQSLQRALRQIAEQTLFLDGTRQATLDDLEPVRRAHTDLRFQRIHATDVVNIGM